MCYSIQTYLSEAQLQKLYDAAVFPEAEFWDGGAKQVSGFAHPRLPILASEEPELIQMAFWGLIPFWTKDQDLASKMARQCLNARSETLAEKPSFRGPFKSKRCLVPISGFYEWRTEGKHKSPYFIKLKDEEVFSIAGLYDDWCNPATGEVIRTFTLVTCEANPLMAEIHNTKKRMPVILGKTSQEKWLTTEDHPIKSLDILAPFDENKMEAVCLEDKQGSLF